MNIKPILVDRNLIPKPLVIINTPRPISFYFNIIICLVLLLGSFFLYFRYINKQNNDDMLNDKLYIFYERINNKLKNIH